MPLNFLDILAKKYGTDKQTNDFPELYYHGYTIVYHQLFQMKRNHYKNILEIGVREGRSHKMWHDYFPNAMIYGVDNMINPIIRNIPREDFLSNIENDRIKIFIGSQDDEAFLEESFKDKQFDLIVDDGGHHSRLHQISFKVLFPKLKSGCYYIIEDLALCNMRQFREFDDWRSSSLAWLGGMMSGEFFSYYIPNGQDYMSQIESVKVIGELGIIRKK
jgi:hypothetical protein